MLPVRPVRGAAGSGDGPTRFPPDALTHDRQTLLAEPAHCLVTTREEVVAGRFSVGELAAHRQSWGGMCCIASMVKTASDRRRYGRSCSEVRSREKAMPP